MISKDIFRCSPYVVAAEDFDTDFVKQFPALVRKGRKKSDNNGKKYSPLICAFDIETSTLQHLDPPQAIMYHWQWQLDRYVTITGRTWDQFVDFLARLCDSLEDMTLVCFVHNLSYEFQFISAPEVYEFSCQEVFAMDERSILKCSIGKNIEFRCSYRLFNAGLGHVTHKGWRVCHVKCDGDAYDYNKVRYPWTPLSKQELQYCYNDVRGLVEAVHKIMDHYHDSLYTLPLTSTGYPRRDCKKILYPIRSSVILPMIPDFEVYWLLRKAFRGGDTHASRHYIGCILENIYSWDRSSSYPDVNVNCKYPMGPWYEAADLSEDYILDLIGRRGKACIMEVEIDDLDLSDPDWPAPYLAIAKCEDVVPYDYQEDHRAWKDNGRILRGKHLKTWITDIDLRIILKEYKGHITFNKVWYAKYGNLPRRFINVINGYYKAKTELHGTDDIISYQQGKAKANGIYGMEATDPIKPELIYNGESIEMPLLTVDQVERLYNEYKKKAWIPYAWGVWTTARARWELHKGLWAVAEDPEGAGVFDLVYWDTDSVKCFSEHKQAFEKINLQYIKRSRSNGGHAKDIKGEEHFLGVYEQEETYKRFITWGAKKYAYEYDDGKPHITIAGVNKEEGAKELQERGGLEALKEGFMFKKGGGTESIYNDRVPAELQDLDVDGHHLHITKNLAIRESSYTLGLTWDYRELLKEEKIWRALLDDREIYRYYKKRTVKS